MHGIAFLRSRADPWRDQYRAHFSPRRLGGPSGWAFFHFLPGQTFENSPCINPFTVDGIRGLLVDIRLAESDPAAFGFVMGFAADNDLRVQCFGGGVRDDSGLDEVAALQNAG